MSQILSGNTSILLVRLADIFVVAPRSKDPASSISKHSAICARNSTCLIVRIHYVCLRWSLFRVKLSMKPYNFFSGLCNQNTAWSTWQPVLQMNLLKASCIKMYPAGRWSEHAYVNSSAYQTGRLDDLQHTPSPRQVASTPLIYRLLCSGQCCTSVAYALLWMVQRNRII